MTTTALPSHQSLGNMDHHMSDPDFVGNNNPSSSSSSARYPTPPFSPPQGSTYAYEKDVTPNPEDRPKSSASGTGGRSYPRPTSTPLSPPSEPSPAQYHLPSASQSWVPQSAPIGSVSSPQIQHQHQQGPPTQNFPHPPQSNPNAHKRATYNAPSSRNQQHASATPSPPMMTPEYTLHPSIAAYQTAHPRRGLVHFGPYILLQTLGEGEFGKVKLGVHQEYGEEVAVKLIRRGSVDNQVRLSKVEREIEVLKSVKHPNIVRLFDVIETEKYIGIILDFANGGELFDHILAHRYLKEKDAAKLFAQLISGVHYLHRKHIVHRDLKLENLLLDKHRNVIITDFGFANRFEHKQDDLMATSCGSPCYAAPELVISEGLYVGSAVDIWSCGVILYAMLSGYLPFDDDPANPDGDNINLLYKYIVNTPLTFPDYISPTARDLLSRMLVPDPLNRCDLLEIMNHPWLSPYAPLFTRSVEELEVIAQEQQQHKRLVSRREMQLRMRAQEQARVAQLARHAARASSTAPSAVTGLGLPMMSSVSTGTGQQRHQSAMPMSSTVPDYLFHAGSAPPSQGPPPTSSRTGVAAGLGISHSVSTSAASPLSQLPVGPNILAASDLANTRVAPTPMEIETSGSGTEAELVEVDVKPTAPRSRTESMHPPSTPKGKQSHVSAANETTPTQATPRAHVRGEVDSGSTKRDRKDSNSPAPSSDSRKRPASGNKNRHTIQVEYDGEAAYEKVIQLQEVRDAWEKDERDREEEARVKAVGSSDKGSTGHGQQSIDESMPLTSALPVGDNHTPMEVDSVDKAPSSKGLPTPPSSTSNIEAASSVVKPAVATATEDTTPPGTPQNLKEALSTDPPARKVAESRAPASMGPPPAPLNIPQSRQPSTSTSTSRSDAEQMSTPPPAAPVHFSEQPISGTGKKDRSRRGMSMDKFGLGKLLGTGNLSTDSFTNFGRTTSKSSDSSAVKLQRAESVKAKEAERSAERARQREAIRAKKAKRNTLTLVSDANKQIPPAPLSAKGSRPATATSSRREAPTPSTPADVSSTAGSQRSTRPPSMVVQADRILPPRAADRSPSNPSITTFDAFGSAAQTSSPVDGPRSLPNASSSAAKKVMDWFRKKSLAKASFPTRPEEAAHQSAASPGRSGGYPGGAAVIVHSPSSIRVEEPIASSSSDVADLESTPTVVVTGAREPNVRPSANQSEPSLSPISPTSGLSSPGLPPTSVSKVSLVEAAAPSSRPGASAHRSKSHRPTTASAALPSAPMSPGASLAPDARMRTHHGVVDQAALTSKAPAVVMQELQRVLFQMGIEVKRESDYRLRCTRPKRKKAGATTGLGLSSVMSGGSLASYAMSGSASTSGVDKRGLPIPNSPSGLLSAGSGIRGILKRGSSNATQLFGASPEIGSPSTNASSAAPSPGEGHTASYVPETLYGEHNVDNGDEVRFSVELTKMKNLPGLLFLEIKRLRGGVWTYKFIYQTILERCETLTH